MIEFIRSPHCLVCFGAFLLTQNCFALAKGPLAESAVPLECQIEGKPEDNFRYAAVQCWLPPNPEVRGILCVVLHPDGVNGRTLKDSRPWQALAAEYGCALIGISIVPSSDAKKCWFEADKGTGDALTHAISHFADVTGIESLRKARLVLAGVCAAGQFAYEFAAFQPERTGGFITIGGAIHRLSIAQNTLHVSALLVSTPDRGPEAAANLESLKLFGKVLRAPWIGSQGLISDYDVGNTQSIVLDFLRISLSSLREIDSPQPSRFSSSCRIPRIPEPCENMPLTFCKNPTLSFLGRPLPILATVKFSPLEKDSTVSGNRMHTSFSIRSENDKVFDGIFLPMPLLSESLPHRLSDNEWEIDLVMNLDSIPSGTFSIEVPVRFSHVGQSVLGGIQVPVQGIISRDIYPVPKALHIEWTAEDRDAFVKLQSRSSIAIEATWIESVEPAWVEAAVVVDCHQLPTIRISPKRKTNHAVETFAGYVIVRATTNSEQRIKIPFYGSIKG